jgi:hypothetical protein
MLLRVYARCVAALEDVWISRMEATLRPPATEPEDAGQASEAGAEHAIGIEPDDDERPLRSLVTRSVLQLSFDHIAWSKGHISHGMCRRCGDGVETVRRMRTSRLRSEPGY